MSNVALLPIVADRYTPCVRTIRIVGLNLTGATMRAQVRAVGDTPGAPLVDLQTVTNGNAEGLRLVSVVTAAGVTTSTVEMVINETTMEALPYEGELGDATDLAWDWQATLSGRKRRIAKGAFRILGDGVTGADMAPYDRGEAYGGDQSDTNGMTTGATLTFGDDVVTITIDGADQLAVIVAEAETAADRADAAIAIALAAADRAQAYANQLPDFVQGSPGASATEVGLFAAAKGMTFVSAINRIRTTGRQLRGDGGAAWYVRWVAPMPALAAGQQDFSWFQAADASRWVLEAGQPFYPQQFGAMGDPSLTRTTIAQNIAVGSRGPDEAAAINAALLAPMVRELIVTAQHWFGTDIRKPSGKHLRGLDRATCGFHRIPLIGNQARPQFGVYSEDDDSGSFSDFFVNCQRSGYTGAPGSNQQQLLNRCSGLIIRRDSRNVRASRVDVLNSHGYSHYTCAGSAGNAGPTPKDTIREDCRAYNGQTGFEETGLGLTHENIDCSVYTDPLDGGIVLPMECAFHSYSGVAFIRRIRCSFIGNAPAVLDAIADGVDSGTIINIDCDYEPTGGQAAIIITNPDPAGVGNPNNAGRRIQKYIIRHTRAVPARIFDNQKSPYAVQADNAAVSIEGGEFRGLGITASTGAVVDIRNGAVVEGSRSDGLFLFALNIDGTGLINWYGKAGSVTAINTTDPNLARPGADFGVTFYDFPKLYPASGAGGYTLPPYRQRVRGEKARGAWGSYNPTADNLNLYVNIPLQTSVASRDLTDISLTLHAPDGTVVWPKGVTVTYDWQSDAELQVRIGGTDPLNNFGLRYSILEWTA
ncbi:hypothetical protein [Sphingomonas sp. Leaf242]|uniref:hypothetical protein n=1 Tax=Sphingomonas sp. Leaf242 TaxID=1736304 RepID=UPI000715B69A|nr:hypothetical protein [Sphingomonas sp. Leaf242]KQO13289.1 hypothetical protein ASF09_03300 [Sphingomonas sp. Leaf242]